MGGGGGDKNDIRSVGFDNTTSHGTSKAVKVLQQISSQIVSTHTKRHMHPTS